MKNEYPHKMVLYLATLQYPDKSMYAKHAFSFEEIEVEYKRSSKNLHVKYSLASSSLPYELYKIDKHELNSKEANVIHSSNGCIPPSRVFYYYLLFDVASEQNELHARYMISERIDSLIRNENIDVKFSILNHRNCARVSIEAKKQLLEGAKGVIPIPLYDKGAFLYSIGSGFTREVSLNVVPCDYYTDKLNRVMTSASYCGSWDRSINHSFVGKTAWEYNGTIWYLSDVRDDEAAKNALLECLESSIEWYTTYRTGHFTKCIKHIQESVLVKEI